MNITETLSFRRRLLDYLFLTICLGFIGFIVFLSISANTDLAVGRFALSMDERITFDGVKQILHPKGLIDFFDVISDGGDHRYGRSLWNSIAIFSLIPERLFGDSGQIIAARLFQVILLITTYCIFAFGILRSWLLRLVLVVTMLTIPFSDYFMTTPKPEPLQIFFLAVFCYFYIKTKGLLSWYWIFLGLAFGTKISTLPVLLVFVSMSVVYGYQRNSLLVYIDSLIKVFIAIFLGLAIAVPILFPLVIIGVGSYITFSWLIKKFSLGQSLCVAIPAVMTAVVLLITRKVYINVWIPLNIWIQSTFLNSTHGGDRVSISLINWLDYFFNDWLIAPYPIGLTLSIFILGYLIFYIFQIYKSSFFSFDQIIAPLTIVVAGLALNIAIMMEVKRLWGFYLYPGTILILLGIIVMADLSISSPNKLTKKYFIGINKFLSNFICIFLLFFSIVYWLPRTIDGLKSASLRTNNPDYILQYSSYIAVVDFLDEYRAVDDKRLVVMFTPSLFPPKNTKKYYIAEFWGHYTWEEKPDIIIFGAINTPRGIPPPKDSLNYKNFLIEREGYASHVAEKGKVCKSKPCFTRELELPNGGEILVLRR